MPSERVKELAEARNKCVADIRDLLDKAEKDSGGVLTPEQDETLKKLETDADNYDARLDREMAQEKREARGKETLPGTQLVKTGVGAKPKAEDSEEETRMDFFRAYLRRGREAGMESRYSGLVAGNITEGGAFVAPQTFLTEVLKAVDDAVKIRQMARVITITQSLSLGVPTMDTDVDDADWTTELATGNVDTGLKTGKRELNPNPLAKRVKLSKKLMQVSAIPIESFIQERLAYKFGVSQEKAFMTGNGANKPMGLFTASSSGISTSRDVSTGNTTTSLTFDGVIEAFYTLKEQYQARAAFLFNRAAIKQLRKLKDGEGQYIWQAAVVAGTPDTLLARPVISSEFVPSTFTAGLYVGMVADFSYYWIVQVLNLEVQRLVELYAEANQVGWIGRMDIDAMPVLQEAFVRLKLA